MKKSARILPKLIRLVATPIEQLVPGLKKTPTFIMKSRTPTELHQLEQGAHRVLDKVISHPLERGMRAVKADRILSKGLEVGSKVEIPGTRNWRPFVPRFNSEAERKAWATTQSNRVVKGLARDPVRAAATVAPGGFAYLGAEKLLNRIPALAKTASVTPYQQRTQHTCSAASLHAVLAHYGVDISEVACGVLIGVRRKRGAETTQIVHAAHKLGLRSYEKGFSSLDEAAKLTSKDIPIIADIQSFKKPGSGHYVVITRIDDKSVHLMDPNVDGNVRTISREEMDARWWDRSMAPPHKMMPKWGVVVLPPSKG